MSVRVTLRSFLSLPTMFLVALFLASGGTSGAGSQAQAEDLFPDKNLEAVVRQQVFEKRNNDKPLTEEDVRNISTIKGRGAGIKDLTGLDHCQALALLDLADNEVSDVGPLKGLERLQSVTLSQNKIESVEALGTLQNLQYLQLADNQVKDLKPLAELPNLRSLYLSNNQISNLKPLAKLDRLWSLYLDGNQVADLKPLAGVTRLSSLDLRGNKVKDLAPLADMTELRYLLLDNNQIENLDTLVKMAEADNAGPRRFAPFWRIYLAGNPLSENAQKKQVATLEELGARVFVEEK